MAKKSPNRTFRARTVIAAQRRVLHMVDLMISNMRPDVRTRLYAFDGTGLLTWAEVQEHVQATFALRVRHNP